MLDVLAGYFFFKDIATDELHSEVGKKILLLHLGYTACNMHLRLGSVKARSAGYRGARIHYTNTRFCFRNCSFVAPELCRLSYAETNQSSSKATEAPRLVLPSPGPKACRIERIC
jgi:hypothetical protein